MTEETPEPQEQAKAVAEQENQQPPSGEANKESQEEKMVPLSVALKDRKKRQMFQERAQELEKELERIKSAQPAKLESDDDSDKYESVTREELGQTKKETIRDIREATWAEQNPEKALFVESELEDFLKLRPNLAQAIQGSNNRLQEAYELLTALSPKQRQKEQATNAQKRSDAPLSPKSVPKSAALNETVDVMNMSDSEFRAWRESKRRRR